MQEILSKLAKGIALTAQELVELDRYTRQAKAQNPEAAKKAVELKKAQREAESAQVSGLSVTRNEADTGWLFQLDIEVSDDVAASYEPTKDGRKYFVKNLAQRTVECDVGGQKAVMGLAGLFVVEPSRK